MGRLSGHILPGGFFIVFGVWELWSVLSRYFICRKKSSESSLNSLELRKGSSRFRNSLYVSGAPCCPNLPLEGILKVVACSIGIIGEFATAFKNGVFEHLMNAQHMTMFFFFGINGAMDILQHYHLTVIPSMDYISGILALFIEAFLFWYHLDGRPPMDVQIHMFIVYVVVAAAVSGICELNFEKSILPALCRIYFLILQGTWFFQAGFILYPPDGNVWDENSGRQMMIVTLIFAWHSAMVFICLYVVAVLVNFRVSRMSTSAINESMYDALSLGTLTINKLSDDIHDELSRNIIVESGDEEL